MSSVHTRKAQLTSADSARGVRKTELREILSPSLSICEDGLVLSEWGQGEATERRRLRSEGPLSCHV